MYKEILDKESIQDPTISGLKKIAGIVKRTLGPGGLPIIIERYGQQALDGSPLGPRITKDGVSVANECSSKNKSEDVIIQAVKSICKKTNSDAGDGTTTAIVLGEAIMMEVKRLLDEDSSLNPQQVRVSIEDALQTVLEELDKSVVKVEDLDVVKQVATISANGDEEIGSIIKQAFDHVGAEGVVTVDEGHAAGISLDMVDGYQFNRGAESRQNFFNNKSLTHFEAENVSVIIYDGKILNFTDLVPALRLLAGVDDANKPTKQVPPTIVIANEFSNEVISFLLMQKQQGGMVICPVKGPHTTHVRTGYYDDLAYYTGGTRLGNGGRSLTAIEPDDIGLVNKVIINDRTTTLYDGQGDEEELLKRVDQLKALKATTNNSYDAQVVNDRIAALTSGVAKIGVGGATELEIKEKYDRIEDALNASRAAIQQGIVPGGGTALLRVACAIAMKDDLTIGEKILTSALEAPFQQILDNIGESLPTTDISKIVEDSEKVYDAQNKRIVNAMEAGIIDPVKVTKSALQNAVSIASLLSTAGGAVIYQQDK